MPSLQPWAFVVQWLSSPSFYRPLVINFSYESEQWFAHNVVLVTHFLCWTNEVLF
jgi:hypothetical protein